jgi:nitrite reductase/ring-hydroxylating ferredoxin subunit
MSLPPEAWTPVALAADLAPGASTGVVVEGAEIVVWRDTKGGVHAWEDRCPHRGMKLSFGFVKGDRIACLYHGWEYDAGGQCRYIPAHPDLDVPATICTNRFGAADAGGFLWVAANPEMPASGLPGADPTPFRSLYAGAPLNACLGRLAQGGFPGLGPAQTRSPAPGIVYITQGGLDLTVAGHAVSSTSCALHIVAASGTEAVVIAAAVPATAAFRRYMEAGA